jgi:4-hydroxybenzoate polyprenyltransferase
MTVSKTLRNAIGKLTTRVRLGAWVELVRFPAVFSVWSNILAAHLIATIGSPHWRLLGLQLAITTCLYWAGMVLNDCFDLDNDRTERPERPLPSGRIAPHAAWAVGFGLLVAGILLGWIAGPGPFLISILLALAIVGYDAWLKHGPLGPVAMGLCRWLNWLLGLSVGLILLPELLLALPVFLYTLSVTLLSRAETVSGNRRAVRHAAIALGLTLAAMLGLYPAGLLTDPYALALTAVTGALLIRRLLRLLDDPTAARVRASVGFMLLCMIPLDALLLAGDGQRLAALGLLLLLLPGWFLAWRVQIT